MRARIAVVVVAAGVTGAVLTVDKLGDLTQTRPDPIPKGSSTEVVFQVKGKITHAPMTELADRLWSACRGTIIRHVVAPGVTADPDGVARVLVTPALGDHGRQRLKGCLEDFSLDRIKGHVVSMTQFAPGKGPGQLP